MRPKNSCASGCGLAKKVKRTAEFFFKFLFHDMPCNITQQLVKQSDTLNNTHEN